MAPTATSEAPPERRLLAYDRLARRYLTLAVAAGALAAALLIASSILLSHAIASVYLDQTTLDGIAPWLAAMLLLALVRAAALGASVVLAQRAAGSLKSNVRTGLLAHIAALGPAYVGANRSGDLMTTAVQAVGDLDEYVTGYLPQKYLVVVVPLLVLAAVAALDPLSVVVLLMTGPLLVLFLVLIGARARQASDRRLRQLSLLSSNFLDLLQGLSTLKMFGRSKEQVAHVQAASREYGRATLSVLRTAFETTFVLELSATVATALVAVEVGLRLAHGSLAFQPALAVLIITPEFFLPIRQLAGQYHARAAGHTATEAIFALLDTPLPRSTPVHVVPLPARSQPGVRFQHVSFRYGANGPGLHDVSFVLRPGGRVALVGPTGAGKTTIANLLLRFIEPAAGVISVDGASLATLEENEWRKRVAWVPQHPHLFYGTVADNIRLARPDASTRDVVEAAHAAGADGFIRELPQGYDTVLGEEGVGLSGGERQRLAIARAFLKDAPYLILDEPTSNLDEENEALVQSALERLTQDKTVLIIAHRPRWAEAADEVIVLKQGRIVARGAPREVLDRARTTGVVS